MRLSKIIPLIVGLGLAGNCPAVEYTMQGAIDAAAKLLPKDAGPDLPLFNLPTAGKKEHAKKLLEFLRAGKGSSAYFALISAKNEFARDLLAEAMKQANKKEQFTGLHLVIVGDRVEPAMFDAILKDRGILVLYAAY